MDPGPEHVDNAIHGVMTVQIERRGAPLRAKALALQLDDTAGLLVTLDLVLLLTGHCDHLRRRLARATGVAAGAIVVHCTHSHSTPFAEPLDGPHPFFDLVCERAEQAATAAVRVLQPARVGFGQTFAAGASFNQRLPLPDGGVKFTRDFREGLASGRPVDPRLSVLRIDTVDGSPLAGWVCFAAHPSVVIFDAPVSAEYPGYLTGRLERTLTGGAPVLRCCATGPWTWKAALAAGRRFPAAWTSPLAVWVIDDLGLVFYGGEPFTEIALELAARSPLGETLLLPMANGSDGYVPRTRNAGAAATSPTPTAAPTGWLPDSGRCPMRSARAARSSTPRSTASIR